MWTFIITSGAWLDPAGAVVAYGYSGAPGAVNDATRTAEHNLGPICVGLWRKGKARDTATHGPCFIPLTPEPGTETHGRSAFGIHGDKKDPAAPKRSASEGCVILPRGVRDVVNASPDDLVRVVAHPADV